MIDTSALDPNQVMDVMLGIMKERREEPRICE
jgi:hypothetical protein